MTNFVKSKGPRSYPTLKLGNNTAKTNPEKAQLFGESVERNCGIESHLFRKSHSDSINKFVEAYSCHFTPLDSLHDNVTDTDDNSDLVADVDPDTLIRIVRSELKNGKAPGIDNVSTTTFSRKQKVQVFTNFCSSLYHIIKTTFYSICLEGSSPLYAHQA